MFAIKHSLSANTTGTFQPKLETWFRSCSSRYKMEVTFWPGDRGMLTKRKPVTGLYCDRDVSWREVLQMSEICRK